MPKITGLPITVAAGQPQRETSYFTVAVTYTTGVPSFQFNAFGTVRLRAADDSVIFQEEQKQYVSLSDAQLPAPVKTAFTTIVNRLDTL